jgi:lipopolysaccharide assembly outer membrane protein LptD (OstA)
VCSTELSNPAAADESLVGSPANEAGESPELEAPNVGAPTEEASTETPLVPEKLKLKADRQFYDSKRKITIAEGNVTARLGEAQIQADRIEFDTGFRTLFARGSVRLHRGNQFFQASVLRYNLVQNEGELDDVYGVIDLEGTPTTPQEPAKKPEVGPPFNGTTQPIKPSQARQQHGLPSVLASRTGLAPTAMGSHRLGWSDDRCRLWRHIFV